MSISTEVLHLVDFLVEEPRDSDAPLPTVDELRDLEAIINFREDLAEFTLGKINCEHDC